MEPRANSADILGSPAGDRPAPGLRSSRLVARQRSQAKARSSWAVRDWLSSCSGGELNEALKRSEREVHGAVPALAEHQGTSLRVGQDALRLSLATG